MANIKVSQMTEATSVDNEDLFMIVQNSTNKKVSKQTLMQPLNTVVTELQEEIEKLKNASYKISGTGTDITLNNTSNNKFLKLDVKGNTEQTQLTGKNILDGTNPTGANYANATLNNNVLKISSTATNTTPFVRYEFNATEGEIYRLNAIIKNTNGQIVFQKYSSSWESVSGLTRNYIDGTSISSISYTVPSSVTMVRFLIYANNNVPSSASESNYENVIVTKDNANMTYEPFCGGTASPNPDYPQPIYNVTGDVNVKLQNKNLLEPLFDSKTQNGITIEFIEEGMKVSGNSTNQYQYFTIFEKELPAGSYVINGIEGSSFSSYILAVYKNNENIGYVSSNNFTFTLTEPATIKFYFYPYATDYSTPKIFKYQLEENSTATSYVANQEQNLPFTLRNDNLFDKNKVTYNYYLNTQGTLDSANNYCVSDYIDIQEGKSYYISARGTNRTKFYDENKQPLTSSYDVLSTDTTFTAPTNAKYIRTSINYTTISLDTFIICEGTSGANCITQRLYEGSNLADDGIHNKKATTVLGDASSLITGTVLGVVCKFAYYMLPNAKNVTRSYDFKCNKVYPANDVWGQYGGYRNSTALYVMTNSDDTLENFNSKISGAIVEYELNEETITPYNETQQAQYNAIKEAMSYYGQTHISSTSDEASAKIDATAIGDLNLVIS